jgi:hypothetical protein
MGSWVDPRFGPGYPDCDRNRGRRAVTLDFGRGWVFNTTYQSGGIAPLLAAVAEIRAINVSNDQQPYKVDIAGTYACRPMRTHSMASLHSWPVAIDINPQNNSMNGGRGDIPQWFADCFIRHGFQWGLDWNDAMHFENPAWYGLWDGTYPEVDDVALTKAEKDALAFIGAHESDFMRLFNIAQGASAAMQGDSDAGPDATKMDQLGFRWVNRQGYDQKTAPTTKPKS